MTASEEVRGVDGGPTGEAGRPPPDVSPPSRAPDHAVADLPSVSLSLRLPHDLTSVAFVRHVTRQSLAAAGVMPDTIDDVELALSEACTNVLNHAGANSGYEVTVVVEGDRCRLQVVDAGRGFDHLAFDHLAQERGPNATSDAERGRGLPMIGAVMDEVELVSERGGGTRVTFTKRLTFGPGAPAGAAPHAES